MPASFTSHVNGLRAVAFAGALAALSLPAVAQVPDIPGAGYAGAFLAAREAGARNDFAGALPYLERIRASQPEDARILESLTVSYIVLADHERATESARALIAQMPENHAAALALLADAFSRRDYEAALELLDSGARTLPLIDGLGLAWAHLGQGRMTEALAALDEVSGQDGMLAFAQYCRALALALVGDVESAAAIMEDERYNVLGALSRRGMIAYAQVLGQLERFDEALALIDDVFSGVNDPVIVAMRTAYAEERALPFSLIADPAEGMAEVYAVMAAAMRTGQNLHDTLLYARGAEWINPDLTDALLLTGQVFEEMGQPELAAEAYGRIAEEDVFGMAAGMGQAQVLETLGEVDQAISVLEGLVAQNPDSVAAGQVLGDFLRRANRHEEAVAAYDRSMAMMEERGMEADWRAHFSRAVSHERLGQWPQAEADFRAALAIEPDQPTVLNYLGYSLVERQENLDEALEMIERAVAGEPDSGYIVDSLAWALYRMGRYDDAVPHMERAVELLPTDPVLNDHLGDVYWAVGREREARFQWRRALSYGPNDDMDMDRVRRKLEVGLDQVRAEEGLAPLHLPE
ncbi:tetratricopeptide repeat protein [Pararhodobacter sp.]|uniref:tetratricopeptide repeat protein n=1 Tax=Pararhodobacter sp. TaxID=2127056 RepID=UPI002FDCAD9F